MFRLGYAVLKIIYKHLNIHISRGIPCKIYVMIVDASLDFLLKSGLVWWGALYNPFWKWKHEFSCRQCRVLISWLKQLIWFVLGGFAVKYNDKHIHAFWLNKEAFATTSVAKWSSVFLCPETAIFCDIICSSPIPRYQVSSLGQNIRDWDRISVRGWIHKRYPSVSSVTICEESDRVITAPHYIWIRILPN